MSTPLQKSKQIFETVGITYDESTFNTSNQPFTVLKTTFKSLKSSLIAHDNQLGEISQWLSFSIGSITSKELKFLDDILANKSYLVGLNVTIADFAVYTTVYDNNVNEYGNIQRWLNHIQYLQGTSSHFKIKSLSKVPTLFPIKTTAVPSASATKTESIVEAKVESYTSEISKVLEETKPTTETSVGKEKTEKKAKKIKEPSTATTAPTEVTSGTDEDMDPSKLDIRVGYVVKCWNHPDSEKLLCEEIDVNGDGTTRTIASGLRAFYTAEQVQGRHVIVLCNLKERSMAGFKSQGMVLCTANEDHSAVQLLCPTAENNTLKAGDKVVFPGFNGEPMIPNQLAKKKVFEKLAPFVSLYFYVCLLIDFNVFC